MIKRFYKNKLYIGVQDHCRDSWGAWQDITTIKLFYGKPDSFYDDEIHEYTPSKWNQLVDKVKGEAVSLGRKFTITDRMATTYPIWR